MESQFCVVFQGKARSGMTDDLAIDLLAKIFKIPEASASILLSKAPIIIKRNLSQIEAETYVMRLGHIGFNAKIDTILKNAEVDRFDQSLIMSVPKILS
jgi:hypothetical protein